MKSKGKLYSKHSSSFPPWHCHTVSTQADDDPLYNSSHRQAHHHSSRWRHAKNLSSSSRNSRHRVKFTVEAPGLCKYSHDSSVSEILSCMSLDSDNSFTKPFMNLLREIVKDIPPEIPYLHKDLIVDALSHEELSLYRIRKSGAKVMLTSSDSVLKFITKRQKQDRRTHIYIGILQGGSSSVNLPEQPSDSMKTSSRVSQSSSPSRRIRSPARNDVHTPKGRQVKFSDSMKTSSRVSESSSPSRRSGSPVRSDVHGSKGRRVTFRDSMNSSSSVSESSLSRRSGSPVSPSTSMKTSSRVSQSSSSRRSGSPVRTDVKTSKERRVKFRGSMNSSSSVSESSLSRRSHFDSSRRIHSRNAMQESNKLRQPKNQTLLSVGENRPSITSCSAGLSSRTYDQECSSKPQVPDDKRRLLARRSVPRSGVDGPSAHVQRDKIENSILSETSRKRIRIYSTVGKSDMSEKRIGPNSTDGKIHDQSIEEAADNPSACDSATGLANCSRSRRIDSHHMNGKGYKSKLRPSSLNSNPLLDSTGVCSRDSHHVVYSSKSHAQDQSATTDTSFQSISSQALEELYQLDHLNFASALESCEATEFSPLCNITKTPSRLPRPPEELHELSVCDKAVDEDSSSDHCRNLSCFNSSATAVNYGGVMVKVSTVPSSTKCQEIIRDVSPRLYTTFTSVKRSELTKDFDTTHPLMNFSIKAGCRIAFAASA